MKRIRSWAWPDPEALQRQLVRAPWGGAYWKRKFLRRQAAMQRVRLIPMVRVSAPAVDQSQAAPVPVVH
jgi:hypothetical protein